MFVVGGCAASGKRASVAPPDADAGETVEEAPDLPNRVAVQDATLGPGDQIQIAVYRHPDLTRTLEVPRSGTVFLPLAGEMNILGVSALDIRRLITERLDRYIVDPQVSVGIRIRRSRKVMVLGEVRRPSVLLINAPMTALEAIVQAGGFTGGASRRRIVLLRQVDGKTHTHVLNLEKTLKKGHWGENLQVQPGDVVFVPRSTLTNIDRFARHLSTWLGPILSAESATLLGFSVEREIKGGSGNAGIFIGN